jgi:hypothetical protein|tara:strand:+ start:752 stop:970 length:219 start_codon:yes stop_codon:yes gene_type:complete
MGTERSRREKIDWIMRKLEWLKIKDKVVKLDDFLALFAINCGSTRQTGRQILKDLETIGTIKIDVDEVSLIK